MNKHDMIEEIIAEHPIELLFDTLWEDATIIGRLRASLQRVSETNLIPYHDMFVGQSMRVKGKTTAEHTPTFEGGIPTQEYIEYIHTN